VLQSLSEEYKVGVQFVMVAVPGSGSLENAIQQFGITFPVVLDDSFEIQNDYGVTFVPKLFILDTELNVCAIKDGAGGTTDALKSEIAQLLDQCGAPEPIAPLPVHEFLAVVQILFGVTQDGGGLVWPGGKVPPWNPLRQIAPETRDALIALAIQQLASRIPDRRRSFDIRRTATEAAKSALASLGERVELESKLEVDRMVPR
jgi:hypothetical protein